MARTATTTKGIGTTRVKRADLKPVKVRDDRPVTWEDAAKPEKAKTYRKAPPIKFDVTRDNAYVVMTSPYTLDTREVRIAPSTSATFWPGYRLVSLFTGNDKANPHHWRAFGYADEFGVNVFGTCTGSDKKRSKFECFAGMLERPTWFRDTKGVTYKITLIK